MKKNIFGKLLCLLMAGTMTFGLVACDPDDGGEGGGSTSYTVTFHMEGHGGTAPQPQTVNKGEYAEEPTPEPEDYDYDFLGWYKEAAGTNKFNFATETIEKDTDLYAKWDPKPLEPDTSTALDGNAKIYLVGDSTVCSFNDKYYIPRYGYGTQLANYLNCNSSQISNLALSGRSSLSFLSESNYSTLASGLKAGDYLIIGFGHNDEKREVARYTDPTLSSSDTSTMIGSYNAGHPVSFKYVLKHNYIDKAKEVGATPILCTPITRLYKDSDKSKYDTGHTTTTQSAEDATAKVTTTWTGGDYAQAIRELAQEESLLCIDLTATTIADYKALGYAEAVKYHAATGAKWTDASKTAKTATGIDATHTNLFGAKMNAYHIANAIKASSLPLAANVKTNNRKPTYAKYESELINSGYDIPDNDPFNPDTDASTVWTGITGTTTDSTTSTVYKWYGTTMGQNANTSDFTITQETDNEGGLTFTVESKNNTSKIQSDDESFGAVFIQVPFKTALTVTATAKVESYGGNQAGFGLMIRDDITIDKHALTNSNFVTAGCRGTSSNTIMCYARNNGSLENSSHRANPVAGDTYQLSLARTSQSITAIMGSYTYNAVSDFDLAVSDSEYVYICLWVTRSTKITFSNITFESGTWVDP